MWAVLLRDVLLPARGRPIRECLSISARNLAAFPQPTEREREGGGEERDGKSERDKEKATCGRCGSVAFTECQQVRRGNSINP